LVRALQRGVIDGELARFVAVTEKKTGRSVERIGADADVGPL
jgi:hypothetical protein